MLDNIYYGNVLGLLKMGRWNLSVNETEAMLAVVKETEKRYANARGPIVKTAPEPIKKVVGKRGDKRGL